MAGGWAPGNMEEWMRSVEQELRIRSRGNGGNPERALIGVPAHQIIDGSTGGPTAASRAAMESVYQAAAAGPPPTPSAPTTEARLGTVTLCWDGLSDTQLIMPKNFDRVEIHRSQEADFVATDQTFIAYMRGAGCYPITDQAYNSIWYYRLVAVNGRGEKSAPSAAVSATTVPLVDTDLIGKIIDGANIIDGSINAADAVIANSITGALIQALAIKAGHLDANSVTTPAIDAGAVTAQKLAALLVLAGTMASSTTGRRWEADQYGIRLYDSDGTLLINLPTDVSTPATFKGDVVARSFTSMDQFALRGTTNEVSRDSWLKVAAGTTAPASPPSVLVYTNSANIQNPEPNAPSYDPRMHGLQRDGAYYWTVQRGATQVKLHRFDATTYALDTGYSYPVGNGNFADGGFVKVGNTVYTLDRYEGLDTYYIRNYDITTGQTFVGLDTDGKLPNRALGYWPALGWDGSNFLIAYRTTSGSLNIQKLTTTGTMVETITTNISGWLWSVSSVMYGTFDYGANRYVVTAENRDNFTPSPMSVVLAYSGSGSVWNLQQNEQWPMPGQTQGMCWDATKGIFVSIDSSALTMNFWTPIKWTTESNQWYASTTWYDPDATGGTHESDQGPRTTFTMRKRGALRITSSPIPPRPTPNTTDDVLRPRFYLGRGASDPGRTGMWLQSEVANGVNYTEQYGSIAFSGTNPPAANNFPGANPGKVTSSDGSSIVIRGDGSGNFGSLVVAGGKTNLGAHVLRSAAIDTGAVAANTWTFVDWTPGPTINEDGWTLSADGIYWTCPVAGTHAAMIRVNFSTAGEIKLEMFVESATDGIITVMGHANGHDYVNASVPAARMSVGDRIYCQVFCVTTGRTIVDTSLIQITRLG